MRNFLKAVVLIPIAIVAIVFAVANRAITTVSFDPFNTSNPAFALSAPLFLVIIAMVMLGVLLGGVATWVTQGANRKALRLATIEAAQLRRDLQDTRLELDLARRSTGSGSSVPALARRDAA